MPSEVQGKDLDQLYAADAVVLEMTDTGKVESQMGTHQLVLWF